VLLLCVFVQTTIYLFVLGMELKKGCRKSFSECLLFAWFSQNKISYIYIFHEKGKTHNWKGFVEIDKTNDWVREWKWEEGEHPETFEIDFFKKNHKNGEKIWKWKKNVGLIDSSHYFTIYRQREDYYV
jgi:hypothetical protein